MEWTSFLLHNMSAEAHVVCMCFVNMKKTCSCVPVGVRWLAQQECAAQWATRSLWPRWRSACSPGCSPALLYMNTPKYTCWMLNLRVFIEKAPGADFMMQLSTLSFFAPFFTSKEYYDSFVSGRMPLLCFIVIRAKREHKSTHSSILWLHQASWWNTFGCTQATGNSCGSTTQLRPRKQQLVFVSAGNLSKQQLPGVERKYRLQISPFQHLVNETEQLALSLVLWDLILLCGGIIQLLQLVNVQLKRAFL